MRRAEFRAHISQSEWKRLRQRKPSAGLVSGVLAITLAWVFSAIGLGPSQLQFGAVQIGAGSSLPVKLTNRGTTEFHAASLALEGEDAKDFDVDTKPCATVTVGATCVLWVDFRPRKLGAKRARLVVRTNDGKEFSSEFTGNATSGKAVSPPPVASPSSAPSVPDRSPDRIYRQTTSSLPPPSPVPAQGQPPIPNSPPVQDPFTSLGGPNVPPPPPTIPAINHPNPPPIVFPAPSQPPSVAPPEPKPALQPLPHLTMTPGAAKFTSSSRDGKFFTSPTQAVVVRSDGTADIKQLRLSVTPAAAPFRYSTACHPHLARGQTCTVQVKFVPQDSRPYAGTLDAYEGNLRLARVDLHGIRPTPPAPEGQPHLTVNPATVQFGSFLPDREFYSSQAQAVVVRSDGTADLRQLNLRIDPSAAPFSYSSQCPALLARGQSCTLQLKFAPRDSRQYAATLSAYDGSSQLAAVSLRGGGTSPSQPANPLGKGAPGGNSPTGTAGPGRGPGANGVAPRGPVIGTADAAPASQNSRSGTANQVAPPGMTAYSVGGGNSPSSNGEPAPRAGNGVSPGSPVITNGGAASDNIVNRGMSAAALAKPASAVAQLPKAQVAPASPKKMPPRPPQSSVQRASRRRPPGR